MDYQGYEKFITKYLSVKGSKPITWCDQQESFLTIKPVNSILMGLFGVSGEKVDKVIQEIGYR